MRQTDALGAASVQVEMADVGGSEAKSVVSVGAESISEPQAHPLYEQLRSLPLVEKPNKENVWADSLKLRQHAGRIFETDSDSPIAHVTTITNESPFHSTQAAFCIAQEAQTWMLPSSDRLELDAPIVILMNTSSVIARTSTAADTTGGSHYVVAVILPKRYRMLTGEMYENEKVRCLYVNSLLMGEPYNELPKYLAGYLSRGGKCFLAGVGVELTPMPEAVDCESITLRQQNNTSDCGWWALYNAAMIIATGGITYLDRFNKHPKGVSGEALRALFPLQEMPHKGVTPMDALSHAGTSMTTVDEVAFSSLCTQFLELYAENRRVRLRDLLSEQRRQLKLGCGRCCPRLFVAELSDPVVDTVAMDLAVYGAKELGILRRINDVAESRPDLLKKFRALVNQLQLELRKNQVKLLYRRRKQKFDQWDYAEKMFPKATVFVLTVIGAVAYFMANKIDESDADSLRLLTDRFTLAETITGAFSLFIVQLIKARGEYYRKRMEEAKASLDDVSAQLHASKATHGEMLNDLAFSADIEEERRASQGLKRMEGLSLV